MGTSPMKWIKRLRSPLPSSRGAQRRGDPAPKGMTLTEVAIVLGIVGLVAGAIWGTATAVKKQQAISDTAQTILQIASTIKATYTGHATTATPPTTVAAQIAAGLYPPGIINAAGNDTLNAWGGTVFIQFPPALAVSGFSLIFTFPANMDRIDRRAVCAAIVSRYPGSATSYAGGFVAGVLPAATIPLIMSEDGMPTLTLIDRGGWTNVTGVNPTQLFPAAADNCTGFAVYFKL